jgi:hypothetical protein
VYIVHNTPWGLDLFLLLNSHPLVASETTAPSLAVASSCKRSEPGEEGNKVTFENLKCKLSSLVALKSSCYKCDLDDSINNTF